MNQLRTTEEYLNRFPEGKPTDDIRSKALAFALDIRKFEIELYWKRTAYFWTLIAASFVGFFALQTASNQTQPQRFSFLISCMGFLLSTGWYLANRGSKYWQENWERHVDVLESSVIGPLYKTTLSGDEFPVLKFWSGYPYSVSKINQLISLFVMLVWIGLSVISFPSIPRRPSFEGYFPLIFASLTVLFTVFLFTLAKGGSDGRPRTVDFKGSSLVPANPIVPATKQDDSATALQSSTQSLE